MRELVPVMWTVLPVGSLGVPLMPVIMLGKESGGSPGYKRLWQILIIIRTFVTWVLK